MPHFFIFCLIMAITSISYQTEFNEDLDEHDQLIEEYFNSHQTKVNGHRHTRDCQHITYGNVTNSKQVAHRFHSSDTEHAIVTTRHAIKPVGPVYNQRYTHFHITQVSNPLQTLSVLEPKERGGCDEQLRATVVESSLQKKCLVAINAGFFNTRNGSCLGNIVSDSKIVMDSNGVQNAHFGITKEGHLFFGYLSEIDLVAEEFQQLVGGVIWILRDGKNYIQESLKIECQDTQETGTLELFANVLSARTVVGSDKDGRVLLFTVDGKTHNNGMSLYELAEVLLEYGFVNAINLDGGGSATYVINETLVNYPTDRCPDDSRFNCARNVSTVLCVHEAQCSPFDCSGQGKCQNGKCACTGFWTGPKCDLLKCPQDCSQHGVCTKDGCTCDAGWKGDNCSISCPPGYYGKDCTQQCSCSTGSYGTCDPVSGDCKCQPGFTGVFCENDCAIGFYGNHCLNVCMCPDGCPCHPETGSCHFSQLSKSFMQVGTCFAKEEIKQKNLVPDRSDEFRSVTISLIVLSIIATASVILNIIFSYKLCTTKKKRKRRKKLGQSKAQKYEMDGDSSAKEISFSEYPMATTTFSKHGNSSN